MARQNQFGFRIFGGIMVTACFEEDVLGNLGDGVVGFIEHQLWSDVYDILREPIVDVVQHNIRICTYRQIWNEIC